MINLFTFPRLSQFKVAYDANEFKQPRFNSKVSILIPARNEEKQISATLNKLINQQYPIHEIIILEDQSDDKTADVVIKIAQNHNFVKMISGRERPEGWLGKNWACQQLSEKAKGDILIFTDADVLWQPDAVLAVIQAAQQLNADLLTVWPTQILSTMAERLVVPMMSFSILAYLPYTAVSNISLPIISAANGQCLVFRKNAYAKIGGHAQVRSSLVEDVSLAKKIKSSRLKLQMADGDNLLCCRMYTDWRSVINGYAKNILAGHGNNPLLLIFSALFHWLIFVFPWLWLIFGWLDPTWPQGSPAAWPVWPLVMISLGITTRMLTAYLAKQPVSDAIFLPISVFLLTLISAKSLWWHYQYGGPVWKGRIHQVTSIKNKMN